MAYLVGVTFSLTGFLRKDEKTQAFVVYCPPLDIYTAAPTRDEVKPTMRSAAQLFIRTCYDRGILERVLQTRGFSVKRTASGEVVSPPQGADFIAVQESLGDFEESFPFQVPMPLVSNQLTAGAVA